MRGKTKAKSDVENTNLLENLSFPSDIIGDKRKVTTTRREEKGYAKNDARTVKSNTIESEPPNLGVGIIFEAAARRGSRNIKCMTPLNKYAVKTANSSIKGNDQPRFSLLKSTRK